MSRATRVFAVLVVLAVGYSLGSCNDDVETKTEVKFIEVPTVKTKIEYRDKVLPFPEECKTAVDALPRIIENDQEQTEAAGNILLALQDLATASAFNDVSKVNEAIEIIREERSALGNAVIERGGAITTFESYVTKCENALPE